MPQRRVRLGDVLDDYCPRERRITNHAVVAMIEDEVKQTRCTTCDADHEYKQGRVPALRRRKPEGALAAALAAEPAESVTPELVSMPAPFPPPDEEPVDEPSPDVHDAIDSAAETAEPDEAEEPLHAAGAPGEDDGPVHRRLIRATLPRPEGHVPERREPEFTMRSGRFDGNGNVNRNGPHHGRGRQRQAPGQGQFGAQRQGGSGQAERNGNRAPLPGGQRGGRLGGQHRGQRQGGGHGRGPKRGR